LGEDESTHCQEEEPTVWNLDAKAVVLLVSNLPDKIKTPRELCNLFGVYGDVVRVKILRNVRNSALVEFSSARQALRARDFLDQFDVYGRKMCVSFSKFDRIKLTSEGGYEDDGKTVDFAANRPHRVAHRSASVEYYKPKFSLLVTDFPEHVTADILKGTLETNGAEVFHIAAFKRRKLIPGAEDNFQFLIDLKTRSDGLIAMAKISGMFAELSRNRSGLKVAFTKVKATKTREKVSKRGSHSEFEVVGDDCKVRSNAGSVLLVSHLPEKLETAREVCNLFDVYGDVVRVKMARNSKSALVDYASWEEAARAKNELDQFDIFERKISVALSNIDFEQFPEDKIDVDVFHSSDRLRRHSPRNSATQSTLIGGDFLKPTFGLQITNFARDSVTVNTIKNKLKDDFGLEVYDSVGIKRRQMIRGAEDNDRILISLATRSDGLIGLAKLRGMFRELAFNEAGLNCCFTKGKARKEKERIAKKGPYESEFMIIPDDQKFPF